MLESMDMQLIKRKVDLILEKIYETECGIIIVEIIMDRLIRLI